MDADSLKEKLKLRMMKEIRDLRVTKNSFLEVRKIRFGHVFKVFVNIFQQQIFH